MASHTADGCKELFALLDVPFLISPRKPVSLTLNGATQARQVVRDGIGFCSAIGIVREKPRHGCGGLHFVWGQEPLVNPFFENSAANLRQVRSLAGSQSPSHPVVGIRLMAVGAS